MLHFIDMDELHFTLAQTILHLLVALGAGAAIGLDREWLHKPAGRRRI
jgi:uncharacterized membrane protein YhiD involved in acid resistance